MRSIVMFFLVLSACASGAWGALVSDLSMVTMTVDGGFASLDASAFSNPSSDDSDSVMSAGSFDGNFTDIAEAAVVNNGANASSSAFQSTKTNTSAFTIRSNGVVETMGTTVPMGSDASAMATATLELIFTIDIADGADGDMVPFELWVTANATHSASTGQTSFNYIFEDFNNQLFGDLLVVDSGNDDLMFHIEGELPEGEYTFGFEAASDFNEIQDGDNGSGRVTWDYRFSIPEPASAVLLGVLGVGVMRRRR